MSGKDPAYYNILIIKDDSFLLQFSRSIKDCDTRELTPVDLSAVTLIEAEVQDKINDPLITMTAVISDAVNGQIQISLTPVQTGTLSGQTVKKATEKIGTYFVRLTWTDGTIETILRGNTNLLSNEGE